MVEVSPRVPFGFGMQAEWQDINEGGEKGIRKKTL